MNNSGKFKEISSTGFVVSYPHKSYIRSVTYLHITWNLLEYIWHAFRIIILSGDIETNLGPKHYFLIKFSNEIRSPFIFTPKLPSSGSLCTI